MGAKISKMTTRFAAKDDVSKLSRGDEQAKI